MNVEKAIPMMYVRGITMSGKTTFSEVVHSLFGYPSNAAETFGGTPFTVLTLISSVNKLPVFFTE